MQVANSRQKMRSGYKNKQNGNALGIGVRMGVALGAGLGAAFGNVGVGIAFGIALGAAFGNLYPEMFNKNEKNSYSTQKRSVGYDTKNLQVFI